MEDTIMKKFSIKVNGVAYDVEVEETGSVSAPATSVPAAAPSPAAAPAAAPTPAAAPAAAPASTGAAGSESVKAPMPGTILSINVAVGDAVKKGQVLLVLEAMKMENEIVSPVDGTVASVNTSKGSSVNAGDLLVSLN
jgi:biotin carboxyl carrier protein